jgi:hypothetical protein
MRIFGMELPRETFGLDERSNCLYLLTNSGLVIVLLLVY